MSARRTSLRQTHTGILAGRMLRAAVGPLASFIPLFALPLCGALFLSAQEYAFWAILASISTVALSLDFGGVSLLTTRYFAEKRSRLIVRSSLLSALGSLIVAAGACVIWFFYSTTKLGTTVPLISAILAISTIGIASAMRSVLMVISQAALLSDSYPLRNFATIGQAVLACIITLVVLVFTHSYWALPIGWLTASVLVLIPSAFWTGRILSREHTAPRLAQNINITKYATQRTVATILGSTLLQADRWVIGAIGGPVVLATYEIAWRFASLPRFLVQNLSTRVGADGASMRSADAEGVSSLLKRSARILALVTLAASILAAAAYGPFVQLSGHHVDWALFAGMCVAFGVLGLSSPLSLVGIAVGKAAIDIPYLLITTLLVGTITVLAAANEEVWLFVYGYLASLLLGVLVFFIYAPRQVYAGLSERHKVGDDSPVGDLTGRSSK